jgi:hypothetical protein
LGHQLRIEKACAVAGTLIFSTQQFPTVGAHAEAGKVIQMLLER